MLAALSVILSMFLSDALAELPAVLTPAEFAKLARRGRNWPYELLRTGKLRGVRLGTRSWRIPTSEALKYLGLDRDDAAGLQPRTKTEQEARGLDADL